MQKKKIDKRSKECKESQKSKGLGDTIEKITEATGIKKATKFLFGEDIEAVEIKGFEGYYVTEDGNVYSTRSRWGVQKPTKISIRLQNGYPSFSAYPTGGGKRSKTVYVHRVIGEGFLKVPENINTDELTINHKNGDRTDNSLSNLEWVSLEENIRHSFMSLNEDRIPTEIVLDILKKKHLENMTVKKIVDSIGVSQNTIEGVLNKGTYIYLDNFNDIARFYKDNELKPNKSTVEKIWSCGCDERKEKLNKLVPYKTVNCLKQKEYKFLERIYKANSRVLSREDNRELYRVYNRVFGAKKVSTTCGSCVKSVMNELKKIYNEYGD